MSKEARPHTTAVILAGGSGKRMESNVTKQRMTLGKMSVLKRSVLAFEKCEDITDIVVVTREDEVEFFRKELSDISKMRTVCAGGDCRVESAKRGFACVDKACEYVAIHDAARPLIRPCDISLVLDSAKEKGAAFAAAPLYDTVKIVDDKGRVTDTPVRSSLVRATTPQIFKKAVYEMAISFCSDFSNVTDDNMMVEKMGHDVYAVLLDNENPKITTRNDIKLAELLLGEDNE